MHISNWIQKVFPTEKPENCCVIKAANRECLLEADKHLNPTLWRKFLFIKFDSGKQHCCLIWKRLDGTKFAHDWKGDRPVDIESDNATDIAKFLEKNVYLAWYE